jgi:alpha-D-xyloside xylohydrolase
VFKRWVAFGLMSSHSRFHGSSSYRVPWVFDTDAVTGEIDTSDQSAVAVTRRFAQLKNRLMPYLYAAGLEASTRGTPVMRPMQLEFPGDPAVDYLDRQYMLGRDLLVAPVFTADGSVEFYLPAGTWTNFFTGLRVAGGVWRRETHAFDSLPLYVREGAVLGLGGRHDRPDYDYLDGLELRVYPSDLDGSRSVTVATPAGESATFDVLYSNGSAAVTSDSDSGWTARVMGEDA